MRNKALFLFLFLNLSSFAFARSVPIRMTGSMLVQKILENVGAALRKKDPKIKIDFMPGDSKTALDALANKKIDVAMFSRNLTSEEMNGYPKVSFNSIIIARDAIMPVVSFEIFMNGIQSLTFEDLMKMYSGEVTNWKQLGGPKQDIYTLDLQDESGTRDVFMQAIFEDDNPLTAGIKKVCSTDDEVQMEVSHSSGAVAYLSSAWTSKKVRGIGIRTSTGVIYPTPDNILNHEYPLTRNLVLVVVGEPTGDVKKLMNFIMGPEGQKVVQDLKFVPAIRY